MDRQSCSSRVNTSTSASRGSPRCPRCWAPPRARTRSPRGLRWPTATCPPGSSPPRPASSCWCSYRRLQQHCSYLRTTHRTLRTCLQPAHDEVVLGLAGGLGQEPVVLHAALLGLVPATCRVSRVTCHVSGLHVSPVEVSVVGAAAAGVVVAAGHVVALGVAVPVVGAAHPADVAAVVQPAVRDLVIPEEQQFTAFSIIKQ